MILLQVHITVDEITPLHIACFQGHLKIAELLIKNGAKLDAKDKEGDTPLANAVYQYDLDLCSYTVLISMSHF